MTKRLRDVLSTVFGIPADRLTDADSPETLSEWDSLTHITLMLALESEFGLQLAAEDFAALRSVATIRAKLASEGLDA